MSVREPEQIRHELDYWRAVLDDLLALNTLVSETGDTLAMVPVHMLAIVTGAGDTGASANAASERVVEAMTQLHAMQGHFSALLELVGGRVTAIGAEIES